MLSEQVEPHCSIAPQVCQQARLSRDARFDGHFFTGVLTTGIYCRSICPAPAPHEKNVRYFNTAIQAANAGLRPCLRCRPDSAPHSNAWRGTDTTLNRAITMIEQGFLRGDNAGSVAQLADKLGISSRYLGQLFNKSLGTSPKRFALYQQLMFAKQLLHQTTLSMTDIAMAAGFNSIRRFNEVFKQQLLLTPTDLRQQHDCSHVSDDLTTTPLTLKPITLTLAYRPPLNWALMHQFYGVRQVTNMEEVNDDGSYCRSFCFSGISGVFSIKPHSHKPQFEVKIYLLNPDDIKQLHSIVLKLRAMFDLDADMQVIEQALTPLIALGAKVDVGLRIPGTGNVFEAACRAILGQQVSVLQATKLLNTLVQHYGEAFNVNGKTWRLFPTPSAIAQASLNELKMPGARKLALNALGQYVDHYPESTPQDWLAVKGIGPWTVAYAQMRGLSEPNVFLTKDLVIKNRLCALHQLAAKPIESTKIYTQIAQQISQLASPWGSYLTFQLWAQDPLNPTKE
jgi:AraC family transcriptional regulator of adaptative response / DNA-3-methyladenine glycosylase II